MPLMQYKAMDERGKTTVGRVEAINVADLELRLRRMGLDLIQFREASVRYTRRGGARIRRPELISFCFHLEQLIAAGVPVIDALSDLRDSVEDRSLRAVIAGMIESIQGGETLSGSMEQFPRVFDNVFINLVRAGEVSGQVGAVLKNITENLKWQDEQAAQIKTLMVYPAIVATVVFGVVVFLMVYLVPQLVQFVKNVGQELPLHTRVLLAVSDIFVAFWYLILAAPILGGAAATALYRVSPSFQQTWDGVKLRIWIIGPVLKKIILARFANYFALMYASGISVLECIRISEHLMGNKAVEEATHRAGRQIADGASISAGFEYAGLFPPLVLRMLRVGENTGALDKALLNISYFYERDVRDAINKMQAMIGPVLTFLLGGLLLWVMVSVLGPIYDLISNLKI